MFSLQGVLSDTSFSLLHCPAKDVRAFLLSRYGIQITEDQVRDEKMGDALPDNAEEAGSQIGGAIDLGVQQAKDAFDIEK